VTLVEIPTGRVLSASFCRSLLSVRPLVKHGPMWHASGAAEHFTPARAEGRFRVGRASLLERSRLTRFGFDLPFEPLAPGALKPRVELREGAGCNLGLCVGGAA
jgi:hypothetical protein